MFDGEVLSSFNAVFSTYHDATRADPAWRRVHCQVHQSAPHAANAADFGLADARRLRRMTGIEPSVYPLVN